MGLANCRRIPLRRTVKKMYAGFLDRGHKVHWKGQWDGGDNERSILKGQLLCFSNLEADTQVVTVTFKIESLYKLIFCLGAGGGGENI